MVIPTPSMRATCTPEKVLEAIMHREEEEVRTSIRDAVDSGRKDEFITWARHDGDEDTGEHNLLHWACDAPKLKELAAKEPSLEIVKTLVEDLGISPNSHGAGNVAPLQLISKSNQKEAVKIIRYLLRKDALPNAQNMYGYTALHEAVDHGSPIAVNYLIKAGANAQILNIEHKSAMDLAEQKRNEDSNLNSEKILEILKAARQKKDDLSASFHGFFYSGNWDSKPHLPKWMTVKDMLYSLELEKKKMRHETRWFHLPANNKEWIEDLVGAILTVDGDHSKKAIESEVHAIMEGIGSFSSSTRPARQYGETVSFISVPLIESDIYVGDDKGLAQRVQERKKQMTDLCKRYAGSVFPKTTLDQFYYEALDEKTIVGRDRSQIFSKHSGAVQHILYVGQLWALWIGKNTLITASQGDWTGTDISSPARRFAQNRSVRKTPGPADIFYELQKLCVDLINYHVTNVRCNDQECTMSARKAFTQEIAKIANDVKRQYEVYMLPARKLVKRNPMIKMAMEIKDKVKSQADVDRLRDEICKKRIHRPTLDEYTKTVRQEGKGVNQKVEEYEVESDELDHEHEVESDELKHEHEVESDELNHEHEVLRLIYQEAREQHQTVVEKIEELASEHIKKGKEDLGREALEVRDDIAKEAEKLAEIMDVIDELNIINLILEEQYEMVEWSMNHKDVGDFVRDVRPGFRALLEDSERVRRSRKIVELLSLRQQEIAITNAVETALSADEQASTKIAATVFTVVTFIYTPFGFGLTILGSGIVGLSSEYSARAAVTTMLVTLLATVALLAFLLPILTVVKQPWNNWVSWTTRGARKLSDNCVDWMTRGTELLPPSISGRVGLQENQTRVEGRRARDPESPQGEKNSGGQILARLRRGKMVAKDDPEGR